MNKEKKNTLWGFYNVLINGQFLGSIVWSERTRRIVEIRLGDWWQTVSSLPRGINWMDGQGCEVYPAGIDPHVHARFGQPKKEDRWHLEEACKEGGICAIVTQPNDDPSFTHISQLGERVELWKGSPITVRFNIGATPDNLGEIAGLSSGVYKSLGDVKIFYASSTGKLLIADKPTQRLAAKAVHQSGLIQVIHAGREELIKSNRQAIEAKRPLRVTDHSAVRSPQVEVWSIMDAIDTCREFMVPTHICHVSTFGGLLLIAEAKAEGLPITCEMAPHYWLLNERHLATMGGRAKMNPALRSEREMELLKYCLCKSLVVDMVASDHAPHELELKANEDYDKNPSGLPGVQTLLPTTYALRLDGLITPQRFADLTSGNAARTFGFPNKGRLAVNMDADLVILNPRRTTTFTDRDSRSLCGWTPYHNMTVPGRIEAVILGGQFVKEFAA